MPIVVAAAGLSVLGAQQTSAAAADASAAVRADQLARLAGAAVRLGHQIEQEVSETDALAQRGGSAGSVLLSQQRARTDLMIADYEQAQRRARAVTPELGRLYDRVDAVLAKLAELRAAAVDPTGGAGPPELVYDPLVQALVAVLDAVPEQFSDPRFSESAHALAMLFPLEHIRGEQRELLRTVLLRRQFRGGELAQLASLDGQAQDRLAQFALVGAPAIRAEYAARVAGPDVATAQRMLAQALVAPAAGGGAGSPALQADPDAWYIAQSTSLRLLYGVELDAANLLAEQGRRAAAAARVSTLLTGTATGVIVILTLLVSVLLAVNTGRRLNRLRRTALAVAAVDLPQSVAAVAAAGDAGAVDEVMRAAAVRTEAALAGVADEIGAVGVAFGALHQQALRLAADQAQLRMEVASLFVALSRRGQTLIQRQSQIIDDFERSETDPDRLDRLFTLGHLAARMRRNEENLLVVAGGEPGSRFTRPVPLADAIRAAAAEIEDYARVKLVDVEATSVPAHMVGDLIHLLAELLENAAVFSPPGSSVRVSAWCAAGVATITVFDEGIGMPPAQLAEINGRLARPTLLTSEIARTMGLYVVAHLAARHEIKVELNSSQGGGTMARVTVPVGARVPAVRSHGDSGSGTSRAAATALRGVPEPVTAGTAVTRDVPVSVAAPVTARALPARTPASAPALPAVVVNSLLLPGGTDPATHAGTPAGQSPTGGRRPPVGLRIWPGDTFARLPGRRRASIYRSGPGPVRDAIATARGGLPLRRRGEQLPPGVDSVVPDRPAGAPDPDLIRARLSGLAGGIAAAQRHLQSRRPG